MGFSESSFESFLVRDATEQHSSSIGTVQQPQQIPLILSPPSPMTTREACDFVKNHRDELDTALIDHGVVLFRGFFKELNEEDGPQKFDSFVQSWSDWQDLSYEKSMSFAVRHKLSSK